MEAQKILILYGSETGTAQDVAERIWRDAKRLQFKGPVIPMDEYDVQKLIFEQLVIFVCSTTGQGDQPTNMRTFWRFLLRKSLPSNSLQFVKFGVLGLGDSSYVKFNYAAQKLHKRLVNLGGEPVVNIGLADDQHDLGADSVVEPWVMHLWHTLDKFYHFPEGSLPLKYTELPPPRWNVNILGPGKNEQFDHPVGYPHERNYKVKVVGNIRTTTPEHFQEVRLLKFIGHGENEDNIQWQCGDVAVVRPQNRRQNVSHLLSLIPYSSDSLLSVTELDQDIPVPLQLSTPITLLTLAINYLDLTAVPRKIALEVLAWCTPSEMEKERLLELCEGGEDWLNYAVRPRRTVVELLADFPQAAAHLPASHILEIFQPIRPRPFSIASPGSNSVNTLIPDNHHLRHSQIKREEASFYREVHLLVAVVRYSTKLFVPRLGLCSNWLAALPQGQVVNMTIRKGSLTFPDTYSAGSIVMVGPGTGVAPFRSFLGEIHMGKFVLFFGCRNREGDFHFKDDWPNIPNLKLITAFSRDQPHKIYVQHKIEEQGELIADMVYRDNGRIYVAGNAKEMPDDVKKALVVALEKWVPMENGKEYIDKMILEGRYQTETWS